MELDFNSAVGKVANVIAERDAMWQNKLNALREQIAREILSKCLENRHQGNDDGMGALTSDGSVIYYPGTFRVCAKCEVAAAIAKGSEG